MPQHRVIPRGFVEFFKQSVSLKVNKLNIRRIFAVRLAHLNEQIKIKAIKRKRRKISLEYTETNLQKGLSVYEYVKVT